MIGPLLHLNASPRGLRSRSGRVARSFLDALGEADVELLDLPSLDLPEFDGRVIEGRYALLAGEQVEPETLARWDEMGRMARELLSYESWLITTPMWNFGVPYRLKHYIDLVTHPGMLFDLTSEGVEGRAKGKTVIVIGAGALDIEGVPELAALDHQLTYLTHWLQFIGVSDIHTLRVAPTYGPEADVEQVMQAACAEAVKLAKAL